MPLHDNAKNAMLDQLDTIATHASIHTAYSATGTNESTGGSPAYARQTIAFDASAAGSMTITGTEVFDIPASTVEYIGLWSAVTAGTFYGMFPLGGAVANPPSYCIARNTGDLIESEAHGLVNTDRVALFGAALAAGLTEGTVYFVVGATTDTFQVSLTSGGAAVAITADSINQQWQKCVPETFGAQGTLTISDMDISLNLVT